LQCLLSPVEGKRLNSAESTEWKLCSNRARRWEDRNALLARRITWQSYPRMKSSTLPPPAPPFSVTRACGIVRPCRQRWWQALSQWSRVTGPPTEDSGDDYGRKSREGDESDKNKDERRRKRGVWRWHPITFLSLASRDAQNAPATRSETPADALALRFHKRSIPSARFSVAILRTDVPSTV